MGNKYDNVSWDELVGLYQINTTIKNELDYAYIGA